MRASSARAPPLPPGADRACLRASCARSFSRVRSRLLARAAIPRCGWPPGCPRTAGGRRKQQIEHALFRGLFGALGDLVQFFFAHHVDRSFHQIAHHGFDVAAHVAHFGVLRGFHFHERAARQPREPPRDFRLAHSGRPDHQNILWAGLLRPFPACSFCRRTRLRSATATARFAAFCPTMYLSSSTTISRGVSSSNDGWVPGSGVDAVRREDKSPYSIRSPSSRSWLVRGRGTLQLLDGEIGIRVDADFAGDAHGLLRDFLRGQLRMLGEARAAASA